MSPGEAKRSEDKGETHVKTREKDQRQVRKSLDGVDIVESEGFWLLDVWLSARESLERDGYLFLLRDVSSTLYVHHDERIVFSNVNCMRICECMRAIHIDIAKNYYSIKVCILSLLFQQILHFTRYLTTQNTSSL